MQVEIGYNKTWLKNGVVSTIAKTFYRNDTDTTKYTQGVQNLPSWLPQIRTCAVKILLKRLDEL